MGGGQMQQNNAASAAASLYDHPHSAAGGAFHGSAPVSDAGDAVMARWLQSAGLQHLASPVAAAPGVDQRLLPNLLLQGYGMQTTEDKQKMFKILRNLNLNGETELYPPSGLGSTAASGLDGFYSPEMRGEFGAGLLDLHAMDDTELLSEHVLSEPFESSPFMPAVTSSGFDNDFETATSKQSRMRAETSEILLQGEKERANEKESSGKESNLAKIKVVVRKRPLNKKEMSRKEDDIVSVLENAYVNVHEPKLKVDLTAYVEKHEFCFDAVLDEHVSNDEVYRVTVAPIIPTIFQRTKATCFAYGQTGSGKTFTMQPLPLKAADDIVRQLRQPMYRNQRYKLWLSYFEIYGGKLFDLLGDRRKLCMREDGRQQVCIVGLQEFEVSDVQVIKEYIEKGNASRSTGSTGANEESSRSHAILQLAIKKHAEVNESRRYNDGNEGKSGKVVGKISFIDLAGSERGADTTDNDRQTRIEGAEINKSLLALKECIRALDNDQIHIPFRGSKLTEVLRDSFVGNSRTVMISCISPNAGSCEHTLNTLRYADRVKSLSKSGNAKKDPVPSTGSKDTSSSSYPVSSETEDFPVQNEGRATDAGRRFESFSQSHIADHEKNSSSYFESGIDNGREENTLPASIPNIEKVDFKMSGVSSNIRMPAPQNSVDIMKEEKFQRLSPPPRKVIKEERPDKQINWSKRNGGFDSQYAAMKPQNSSESISNSLAFRQIEPDPPPMHDGDINALLEEEEALIAAHRKEIEETMEIVREEMKLLAEVDQPGSLIDNYVTQLSFVLSRKAAGLVSLQARLARFQHRLKEQEILSRKKIPR